MNIKPHEILGMLGMNIDEKGIVVDEPEFERLKLLFSMLSDSINVENIAEEKLLAFHRPYSSLKGITVAPKEIERARQHVATALQQTFNINR